MTYIKKGVTLGKNIDGNWVYLKSSDHRFDTDVSAKLHAEKVVDSMVSHEEKPKNWPSPYVKKIVYGPKDKVK